MAAVTGSNTIQTNFQQQASFGIGGSTALPNPVKFNSVFQAAGALLDQCNLLYAATLTLVASTPQTLNLKTLTDLAGNSIAFARVRFVAIRNNATNDAWPLLVGAAGTNEWDGIISAAGTISIAPSTAANHGFAMFQLPNSTGAAVGASTHDLKFDPGAHGFTVDVLIAGCDA